MRDTLEIGYRQIDTAKAYGNARDSERIAGLPKDVRTTNPPWAPEWDD